MESDSPDSLGLGLDEPPQPERAQPYRVLARKYRPQSFEELIGQDAMVQTLGNAIRRDRLAHAFLLTGVRGVGKTSTARLVETEAKTVGGIGHGSTLALRVERSREMVGGSGARRGKAAPSVLAEARLAALARSRISDR